MAKQKAPAEPVLVDPEHELNPDVYRAPEPEAPVDEPAPADESAADELPADG